MKILLKYWKWIFSRFTLRTAYVKLLLCELCRDGPRPLCVCEPIHLYIVNEMPPYIMLRHAVRRRPFPQNHFKFAFWKLSTCVEWIGSEAHHGARGQRRDDGVEIVRCVVHITHKVHAYTAQSRDKRQIKAIWLAPHNSHMEFFFRKWASVVHFHRNVVLSLISST